MVPSSVEMAARYELYPFVFRLAFGSMAVPAIFVHDAGEYRLPDPGTVVALTAAAFEACRCAGLTPSVLDDHTAQPEICRDPLAYQRWLLDWLDRLDAVCHLDGVARSCAQMIVPSVDSLVVSARMLAGAVDALAPESITYVGKVGPIEHTGYHNGHLQFWPSLGDVPLAGRLLPLIAAARSIPFVARSGHTSAITGVRAAPFRVRVRRELSRSLGPYRRAYRRHITGGARRGTTLMMWYAGYGSEAFAADERRAGRDTVFITRGGSSTRVIDPSLPPRHPPGRRIDLTVRPVRELHPAVQPLLAELDKWTGVPGASAILETRLAVYLHGISVTVAGAARGMRREISRLGIDRLAAANPSSLEEFTCLIAARSQGIPRVLVQHGDHLLSYGSWLITQTRDFDEFAASDPTMVDELNAAAARLGVVAPHVTYYTPRVAALHTRGPAQVSRARTVCYVPSFLLGDSSYVGGCNFDDAWYYRWHLRLLDLMASRPDVRFIWKGLPSSDQSVDPIPEVIARRAPANVEYESRPFTEVAGEMERVFTDYPSTALYETVHLGKPILALTFPRFCVLRSAAAVQFAQVLRPCDSEEEALEQIVRFLDADPADWKLPADRLASP